MPIPAACGYRFCLGSAVRRVDPRPCRHNPDNLSEPPLIMLTSNRSVEGPSKFSEITSNAGRRLQSFIKEYVYRAC